MKNKAICALAAIFLLSGCSSQFNLFDDFYIAFDLSKSSTTYINEAGEFAGSYSIHFCTSQREETVSVTVDVIPGDGLQENVDYRVVTASTVKFAPGVYDKVFIIEWLPNKLDSSKDNTLTLSLRDCSDESVTLGVPGPSQKNRTLKLYKTK